MIKLNPILALLTVILVLLSCTKKHMPVEEAKKVTASFAGKGFTPPPKTISDITETLNRNKPIPEGIKQHLEIVNSVPPKGVSDEKLALFYYNRGYSKWFLGRPSLKDLRKSYRYVENNTGFLKSKNGYNLLTVLGKDEYYEGNTIFGIKILEQAKSLHPKSSAIWLAWRYAILGDFEKAKQSQQYSINKVRWSKSSTKKQTVAKATASLLEMTGKYAEAEPLRREALQVSQQSKNPWSPITMRKELSLNLVNQERLVEAEIEIRLAIKEGLKIAQKEGLGYIIKDLAIILLEQGRFKESEQLMKTVIQLLKNNGFSEDSQILARYRFILGQTLMAQERWDDALVKFRKAQKILVKDLRYASVFLKNNDFAFVLIKTGHFKEAINILKQSKELLFNIYGKKSLKVKNILAFLAVAYAKSGNAKLALRLFQQSIPALLHFNTSEKTNKIRLIKYRNLFAAYIDFLIQNAGGELENGSKYDFIEESFKISDFSRAHSVQVALAKSGARAALNHPELAYFSKKKQDAQLQIQAFYKALSNHISLPKIQQKPSVIRHLKKNIQLLEEAQTSLGIEIEKRFPDYAELSKPKPTTIELVQSGLNDDEALISLYVAQDRTYIWAIPQKGHYAFATAKIGKEDISKAIAKLRKTLDLSISTFGDIPDFDISTAHRLYQHLLEPVKKGWGKAKELIVVGHEALNQIPFSLLITQPITLNKETGALFSKYRKVPWLVQQVAITNAPSANSFINLRSLPVSTLPRREFVGFGDPIFNKQQALSVLQEPLKKDEDQKRKEILATNTRGLRIVGKESIDHNQSNSLNLEMLQRLPDTYEEVLSVASALNADPKQDVFLQKEADEQLIKTMDLSNRKVILFSTHALVPGDLDGLHQPAIALSSPTVTGNNEDGLLTMDEIMGLRLNADWVVLSACNTAAASGKGAEAVSGLGRAFFYAGTRAVLVSHWSVESTSAKTLVTTLFRNQKNQPAISRSQALHQTKLELIKVKGLIDPNTQKVVISYAHPIFWAPFTLVGEGSSR